MRLIKKVTTLFLAGVVCFSISAAPVLAADKETTDELEVSLTADKDEYAADEAVKVTVSVKNISSAALNNVSVKTDIPSGIKLAEGSTTSKTLGSIEPGATANFEVSVQKGSSTDKVPGTGDLADAALWIAVISVAGIAVTYLALKKKNKAMISVMMTAVMASSALVGFSTDAQAASGSVTVDKTITVGGEKYTIKATVSFSDKAVAENAQVENGGFETGDLTGWTTLTDNWGKTEDGKAAGVFGDATYWNEELPYNQVGDYHLDGWKIQENSVDGKINEAASWGVRSSIFTLDGSGFISVKMGGNAAAVKVFLKDGTQVGYYKQTRFSDKEFPYVGKGGSWADMGTYVMDLSKYTGQEMYIELWDEAIDGGWAVAFFDDVVTYYATAPDYKNMSDKVMDGHKGDETATEISIPWQLAPNQK